MGEESCTCEIWEEQGKKLCGSTFNVHYQYELAILYKKYFPALLFELFHVILLIRISIYGVQNQYLNITL